jgi:hypothetical protein
LDTGLYREVPGHVTKRRGAHYSTAGLDEKLVAVSSVHRLVPLGSGDGGGDANLAHEKAGEG